MSWIKQRSKEESLEIFTNLSGACADLGGLESKIMHYFAYTGQYEKLINRKIDYSSVGLDDAIYARQIQAFYSKLDFLELGLDLDSITFDKFAQCEAKCKETNARFRIGATEKPSAAVESILFMAQCKITNILGVCPSFEDLDFAFGPGANTNVCSSRANPRIKLSAGLECSTNATRVLDGLLNEVPHWVELHATHFQPDLFDPDGGVYALQVSVQHGKLCFVPKTSQTHRPIVVEPLLNSFFQKGFGTFIRDRLMECGVDLKDQSRNQKKAMEGSVNGYYATLDLSSASDTIARNVVWSLLPYDWADALDSLRTPSVSYNGNIIHLEKFSSMGNAYTFELESLIFYSLVYSVCKYLSLSTQDISVYGDDLIIPADAYDLTVVVLEWCGFSVNMEKSYHSGPFRESCGADYLLGNDIRPFYPKTRVSDRTLYTMHNWFIRHGECKLAKIVESFTHPAYRIYGPNGFGDGHLIGSFHRRTSRNTRRAGWCGGYFDTYSLKPCSYRVKAKGDAVLPIYSVYTRSGKDSPTDPDVVRGSRGYAKLSIYTLSNSVLREHC